MMKVNVVNKDVSPEILAVITATVYDFYDHTPRALRIKRDNYQWSAVGRQKIMDARL